MKRILFVTYHFAGTGANMLRYRSLTSYLNRMGLASDVIGYYELKEDLLPEGTRYYRLKSKLSFYFLITFISLAIQYLYLIKVQGLFGFIRRVGLASSTYTLAIQLIHQNKYDACLISIAPWAYYLIVNRLEKHMRVVLDICDPLYKNAILPLSNHLSNCRLEKGALQSASLIVTVNEPSIYIMTNEMGIDPRKIRFITPAMYIDTMFYGNKTKYRFGETIRLLYTGSLYEGYRDLNEVIPAINTCGSFTLDIFTNSVCKPKNSKNVRVFGVVPHEEVLKMYQQYDILLFVDNYYGYQVPSKIFELIAQNRPILFIYDKRNMYLYNMLIGQEGILFVENDRELIVTVLRDLMRQREQIVNYTLDLSSTSELTVNRKLYNCLTHEV